MRKFTCPNCNKRVSIKWIFNSSIDKNYICPKCGTKLKWNKYKKLSSYIGNITGLVMITITGDKWFDRSSVFSLIISFFVTVFIVICSYLTSILILPNLISEDNS